VTPLVFCPMPPPHRRFLMHSPAGGGTCRLTAFSSGALPRPVTTVAVTLGFVLLGAVSLRQLPVSLLPDVSIDHPSGASVLALLERQSTSPQIRRARVSGTTILGAT
jgi:hypothetical protein